MNISTNASGNYTDVEEYVDEILRHYELEYLIIRITIEALTLAAAICVISNLFTCSIIIKFRRLRQNPTYKIIAGWLIMNSVFLLTSPLALRTGLETDYITYEMMCSFGHIQFMTFFGSLLLIVLLTFQWYFKFYYPSVCNKYDRAIIYYILSVCTVVVVCIVEGIVTCYTYDYILNFLNYLLTTFTFFVFIVFMVIMNVINLCRKKILDESCNKNLAYMLSNMFFILHLSLVVVVFVYAYSRKELYVLIFLCMSFLITLFCPLYFFFMLYKRDKNFNALTKHIVTCRCTKYTGDEFVEQPIHYENQQEV